VELLGERGPSLGRPAVERIRSSRHHNLKELRSSEGGALRVLFMFDPRRQVILLLGGDKSGRWNEWYEWAVPAADELYDVYLDELGKEGLDLMSGHTKWSELRDELRSKPGAEGAIAAAREQVPRGASPLRASSC